MNVRAARPEDARAIAEVHVQAWREAYRHAFPAEVLAGLSVDEREAMWRRAVVEDQHVWMAIEEEAVVGFAAVGPSRTEESAAELYAIYVLPERWGSGAAHTLMARAIDWFVEEQYTTAMLWVLADNPRARRFYEGKGWRFDGTRTEIMRGTEVEQALYRLTLAGADNRP